MSRGMARVGTILALVAVMASCSGTTTHNASADPAAHEVDGYWVVQERSCDPADPVCAAAISTATTIWRDAHPDAAVTKAVVASFPILDGKTPSNVSLTFAGLSQPTYAILDVGDGSRHVFTLMCGPEAAGNPAPTVCHAVPMDAWKVG